MGLDKGGDMAVTERMHQEYEDECPVTRRECYIHRHAFEQRMGGLEADLKEIKYEQRLIKQSLDDFHAYQIAHEKQLFIVVIIILMLVAAGRLFDIDAWLGAIP